MLETQLCHFILTKHYKEYRVFKPAIFADINMEQLIYKLHNKLYRLKLFLIYAY